MQDGAQGLASAPCEIFRWKRPWLGSHHGSWASALPHDTQSWHICFPGKVFKIVSPKQRWDVCSGEGTHPS